VVLNSSVIFSRMFVLSITENNLFSFCKNISANWLISLIVSNLSYIFTKSISRLEEPSYLKIIFLFIKSLILSGSLLFN
jgi:hypothetical protein